MKSESIIEITKALAKFQGNIPNVEKTSINPYFKSKYADLSAIWDVIRKPLADCGLAISQGGSHEDGHDFLETMLSHESGEWISYRLPITPGKPNDPQAIGSAITYARRYALAAILGIASEEDDDAELAMERTPKAKKANPIVEAAKEMGAVEVAGIKNAGEFLTRALKEHGLTKTEVEKLIGLKVTEISNYDNSWEFLLKNLPDKQEQR